jgi:hypothetical protein
VYERKLYIECGNFLKLEQEKLEMKKHYESRIEELQKQNKRAIDKLLQEFKANMIKVEAEYVDSKKTGVTLQDVYDRQLDKMEANHEDQIVEIKQRHVEDRQKLKEQYEKYLKEQEAIKGDKKDLERERDREEDRMRQA